MALLLSRIEVMQKRFPKCAVSGTEKSYHAENGGCKQDSYQIYVESLFATVREIVPHIEDVDKSPGQTAFCT